MYFKMAFNNVKKSFKDYTIYFLTLTFAVCIFYSFNSINGQTAVADMNAGQREYIKLMNQFISILSIGVSVILGGLIIYATNFLIKRRKKEFGIYMILGMKKKSMSIILFLETLYIGIISLVLGLLLGLILAQILSIFTAKLFVLEMSKYSFSVSYDSILKTILYFGLMYILVMIFNVFVVSKYKLIDLLAANKKNEKIKIRNIYISTFILILSMIIIGSAYYYVKLSGLNYYKLEFKLSICLGILGTLLFFYGLSSVMLSIFQKNSNLYLNKLNCFNIRQIASKFNTNFISMTIICLMLLVTIGTLACGLSVKDSMEATLDKSTQFDASITIINLDENSEQMTLNTALQDEGYNLGENENYMIFKSYSKSNLASRDLLKKYMKNKDTAMNDLIDGALFDDTKMIPISVYNDLRQLKGEETIDLKENEILVACNYEPLINTVEEFTKNEDEISIDGKNFKIKEKKVIDEYTSTDPSATSIFDLIVPDSLVKDENVVISEEIVNLNFIGENKKYAEEKLTSILNKSMLNFNEKMQKEKGYCIYGMTKQMCYDASRGISTIILFIAVYLGIVFLLASAAVLALQQLSSCNESIDRYRTLRKIGATKSMINKSIFTQVCTFFMLPLSLSIVHSFVGIKVVNSYLIVLGSSNQLNSILVTALIMVIVYGGYLYGTYISYKNVINSELN